MSSIQRAFAGPVLGHLVRNRLLALMVAFMSAGLIFIGTWLPFNGYEKALVALMALVGLGCLTVVLLLWPPSGLLILLVAGLTVSFEIGTGTQTSLNLAFLLVPLLLLTWLGASIVFRQKICLLKSRAILPLLLLAAAAILSFIQGQFSWFPVSGAPMRTQIAGLSIFLFSIGVFLLAAYQMTDPRWLKRLTWLFLGIGVVLITSLFLSLGDIISWFPGGARGATGSLFWTWFVALAFAQALSNRKLHFIFRIGIILFVLATMCYAMTSRQASVSGWLPPLVAMLAILFAIYPRSGTVIILVVGILTLAFGLALLDPLMEQEQYSWLTRLEAWRIVAQMSQGSLLLGYGPANYYYYTELYSILGWHVRFSSHNQYLDILAQVGIIGLACYFWFAFEMGRIGWTLRHRVGHGFTRAYVLGVIGGLAGTLTAGMLADWVLPFVYNVGLAGFRSSLLAWVFLGGLVAVQQAYLLHSQRAALNGSEPIVHPGNNEARWASIGGNSL